MANTDDIFERIIESLNSSRQNSISLPCKNEDYVAPILDYTSEVFSNPNIEYNHIHLICCDGKPHTGQAKVTLRRWSWSRSIVSNSLLSYITGHGQSPTQSRASPNTGDTAGCTGRDEDPRGFSGTSEGKAIDIVQPRMYNTNRKCNETAASSPGYPLSDERDPHEQKFDYDDNVNSTRLSSSPIDTYIDFYSYADMLNSEIAEGFRNESQMDRISFITDPTGEELVSSRFSTISMDDYVNGIVNDGS